MPDSWFTSAISFAISARPTDRLDLTQMSRTVCSGIFCDLRFLEPPKCITRLVVAFCRLFIFYLFVLLLPPFYTSTSHNSLLYIYNFSNRWTLIVIADISDDIHHSCPFFPKFFVFSYLLPKSIIYMYCNLNK